jgi:hypothetical protein
MVPIDDHLATAIGQQAHSDAGRRRACCEVHTLR